MLSRVAYLPAFLVVSLCAACSPIEESEVEETTSDSTAALITDNGTALNGIHLNGTQLNGIQVNGIQVNGIQVNGIQVNGIQVNGSSLSGTIVGGTTLSGPDLIGATMTAALSNGGTLSVKVDDVTATSDPMAYLYTVSYYDGANWQNLCGSDASGPIQGYVLKGLWNQSAAHVDDPSQITFACRGAALAKCVDMGYKPWKSVQECKGPQCHTLDVEDMHQACIRMVRADYCGDGVSHTVDGTPIDLWDNFRIQDEAPVNADWKVEAEWSPSGAECVKNLRHDAGNITKNYLNAHCPERWTASYKCFDPKSTFFTPNGYTAPIDSRSLIRNKFNYAYVNGN